MAKRLRVFANLQTSPRSAVHVTDNSRERSCTPSRRSSTVKDSKLQSRSPVCSMTRYRRLHDGASRFWSNSEPSAGRGMNMFNCSSSSRSRPCHGRDHCIVDRYRNGVHSKLGLPQKRGRPSCGQGIFRLRCRANSRDRSRFHH